MSSGVRATVLAVVIALAGATGAQAASAPQLTAKATVGKQANKTYLEVVVFSAERFEYPAGPNGMQDTVTKYGPKKVTMTVGGRTYELRQITTVLPEFIFPFQTTTKRKVKRGAKAVVTFTSAQGTSTVRVRLKKGRG